MTKGVLCILNRMDEASRQAMGERARLRIPHSHTAVHRAKTLERELDAATA